MNTAAYTAPMSNVYLKEIKKLTENIEIKNTINDDATKIIFELKRGSKQEAFKTLQLIKIQLHDIEIDS